MNDPTELRGLMVENSQLKADLERQMAIANEHVNEVERLRELLARLESAEENYRQLHDRWGGAHMTTGRAWDILRTAGDKSRAALEAGDSRD